MNKSIFRLINIILLLLIFSYCEDKEKKFYLIVSTFENQSTDKDSSYIGVGVTDEIISKLSGVKNFKVLSQDALLMRLGYAQIFDSAGEDHQKMLLEQIESIGEKPDYIVFGSYEINEDLLTLYAYVVDRKTKQKVADHKEEGTISQWGQMRGILTLKLMEKMNVPLTPEDIEKIKQVDNSDFAAFRENYNKKIQYYKSMESEIANLEKEVDESKKKARACEAAAKEEQSREVFTEEEKLIIYKSKLCGMTLQGYGFNKTMVSDLNSWYSIYSDELISILKKIPDNYYVEIQGHSDASVVKNKTELQITSNEKMSETRAKIIYDKLIFDNVPEDKLAFVGYSFTQTPEWLGKEEISNRRVLFVLKNKEEIKKNKRGLKNSKKKK